MLIDGSYELAWPEMVVVHARVGKGSFVQVFNQLEVSCRRRNSEKTRLQSQLASGAYEFKILNCDGWSFYWLGEARVDNIGLERS